MLFLFKPPSRDHRSFVIDLAGRLIHCSTAPSSEDGSLLAVRSIIADRRRLRYQQRLE
jgi:hypothetical protein